MAAIHRTLAVMLLLVAGLAVAADPAQAATAVCAQYCDTRDSSLARQETFPVATLLVNNRQIRLHVSDLDAMAWASIDGGTQDESVWLDRTWDGGATWEGLLGKAWIPAGWTGTRTLMYNLADPSGHRRGMVRACGDARGVACTGWVHAQVCSPACDNAGGGTDAQPVSTVTLSGRTISLHFDAAGMAWGTITGTKAGDEVWLDRSFDGGAGWPGGSSLGRTTSGRTNRFNATDPVSLLYGGAVRACGRAVEGQNGACTAWTRPSANRLRGAADALMYSYDPNPSWWPSSWWNSAVALSSVIGYTRRTGGEHTYKNAVTIGLYLRLTAELHNRIAGDTAWLNRAVTGWNWFTTSGMVNSAGLVNDGITAGCQNNGQTVWTYNQGLAIGAATELFRATGQTAYQDAARRLGTAALNSSLVQGGVLTESCDRSGQTCDDNQKQFKGVFMRYLAEAGQQFQSFADAQATGLWNGRDPMNRIGNRWAPPASPPDWRTQASALSALLVAS